MELTVKLGVTCQVQKPTRETKQAHVANKPFLAFHMRAASKRGEGAHKFAAWQQLYRHLHGRVATQVKCLDNNAKGSLPKRASLPPQTQAQDPMLDAGLSNERASNIRRTCT